MNRASDFWMVLRSAELLTVLERHELGLIEIYKQAFNCGLKFSKTPWTLQLPAHGVEGVNIHFESRKPGDFRIDVELAPYKGTTKADTDHPAELRDQIELRSRLIQMIREKITADTDLCERLGVTTKWLKEDPQVALGAVRFANPTTTPPSPGVDAQFFAQMIDRVAPLVDQVVGQVEKQLRNAERPRRRETERS